MAMVKIVAMVLALAVNSCWARCPARNESVALDLDKFAGTWYLVASSPTVKNYISNCSALLARKDGPTAFSIAFALIDPENGDAVTYFMTGTKNDDIVGTWRLGGSCATEQPFIYRIVEANYTSHLSWVACPQNKENPDVKEFSMILSRTEPLSPTLLTATKDKLGVYVGVENIHDIDRVKCPGSVKVDSKKYSYHDKK